MKRCPKCQKEFPDSMRFCQTDGTSLIEAAASSPASPPSPPLEDPFKTIVGKPHEDPFKTVVGGGSQQQGKDDDILQLPDDKSQPAGGEGGIDPMKTMVVSPDDWKREESSSTPGSSSPFGESSSAPPKFDEASLNPPNFGDLSSSSEPPRWSSDLSGGGGSSSSGSGSPSPFSPPANEPKSFEPPPKQQDSPFGQPPSGSPFGSPFDTPSSPPKSTYDPPSSPFDDPKPQASSSPFDAPPAPPFKDPESPFGGGLGSSGQKQQSPFDNSPFSQPPSPFGSAGGSSDPFAPASNQPMGDWNPPPAPVQSWQDQGLGANTPFQPPAAGAGQNQTLAIVSLVSGVLSCLCCFSIITGPAAIIMGFMAKGKADADPANFGGRGLALGGMITGVVGTLIGLAAIIIQLFFGGIGRF